MRRLLWLVPLALSAQSADAPPSIPALMYVEWGQIVQMEQTWLQRAQQICGARIMIRDAQGIPVCGEVKDPAK